ncbi:MAG TPA: SIS domain-containing protein [Patescibacteria group bacterium]|nr:SIS domain-containing protein [Patescibacteria group bacterium]
MNNNIDSLGVGTALQLFPDQIRESFKQALSANITRIHPGVVIISGMGGSSNAAKIVKGLYESELKIPFEVFNDYGLPAWANSETLVIANSYSGNTEETLSAIEAARKIGAKVIGVTTGGTIAEMIKAGEIQGAIVTEGNTNPTHFPKTGLGISFGALAGVLSKIGILDVTEDELNSALLELQTIKDGWDVKNTASWINGGVPVLLGARPLMGAINAGRNAMCEISRNFTQYYDFPELDHVLVEALGKPESVLTNKYLFFISKFNNPRVITRYKVTAKIFKEQNLSFSHYALKGSTKLTQSLELPFYCATMAYELSLLQNTDPGPEPWIIKLKESLS